MHRKDLMLKRLISSLVLFIFLPLHAQTPVETHGYLLADGNQIIGSIDEEPVQIAGMSMYWTAWGGENFYNRNVVESLVDNWNITLIRAAMTVEANYASGYLDDSSGQKLMVKTIVDAAIQKGIYVIVDWHDHDANLHVEKAKEFFGQMAQEYGNTPNIIWEIWNEPENTNGTGENGLDTWEDIKNYSKQVIPVIREYSSNLIVVGTPCWSQHVDTAADDPLTEFENIAYTLHFYAGTHADSLRMRADYALERGIPLFITEFGLSLASGDGGIYTDSTETWLNWADENMISWANWSLSDMGESSAALVSGAPVDGNWGEEHISESGKWIRDRLLSRPEYEKPIIDTLAIPRLVEAETFISVSDNGPQIENPGGSVSGGASLGYTTPGCWAEYTITVQKSALFSACARVASGDGSNGGTIKIIIENQTLASWDVENTGGWQNWIITELSPEFALDSGKYTLRVEWEGEGSSLVNLDYIDFMSTETSVSDHSTKKTKRNHNIRLEKKEGYITLNTIRNMKTVSLFSLDGRLVFNSTVHTGKMKIPVRNGIYLLNILHHDGITKVLPVTCF